MGDVIIIANQKRTIAVDGGEIPCTFDPLNGNAGKWVEKQPCVGNWLYASLRFSSFLPSLSVAYQTKDGTITLTDTDEDGGGFNEIAQSFEPSAFGITNWIRCPVWKRGISSFSAFLGSAQLLTRIEIYVGINGDFDDPMVVQQSFGSPSPSSFSVAISPQGHVDLNVTY